MKKILASLIIVMLVTVMGLSVFAHSGDTDKNGGHFEKYVVNNVEYVLNYHFHDKVTNTITKTIDLKSKNILWKDRYKIDIDSFLIKTTPPVIKTIPPVIKTTPPVIKTTPPVIKTTPPVIKTTPPVIKTTPPVITTNNVSTITSTITASPDTLPKTGQNKPTVYIISGTIICILGIGYLFKKVVL
jgi:LPXTG-motif cell wall-anchored protein